MIRLQTFGTLDLRAADGREIRSVLAQPKRTALLAYLAAAHPTGFRRRDALLGVFWPESDQQRARDSLRQAVRYLRRSLGEGALVGRGDDELAIDRELVWCDATAFHEAVEAGRLEEALELYRGDFLTGFFLSGVPEFERWIEAERARLRAEAVAAAWSLSKQMEAAGDSDAAVRYGRRAAWLSPDDEPTVRRLMELAQRLGDHAGALRAYQELAQRLEAEYGAAPSAETRAIIERVAAPGAAAVASEVARAADQSDFAHDGQASGPALEPGAEGPDRARARRRTPWAPAAAGLALLVMLGAALSWRALAPTGGPSRVMVLPFENRTGDPSLDPLGYWAADRVARDLARTELEVANGTFDFPTSGSAAPRAHHLRSLVERGQAGLLVAGSFYRAADSIQFQVQVTDPSRGSVIAGLGPVTGSLDQPQQAVGILGERVTGAVAAHLNPAVRALNSDGSRPPSYEAYRVWADGLRQFGRRDYVHARERLLHAASLDSSFVTPLIWAAAASANLGELASADSLIQVVHARRNRLLAFDLHLLDLWRASLRGDLTARYDAVRQMRAVAPTSEIALYLFGGAAIAINRPGEAAEALRQLDLDRSGVDWDAYGVRLTDAYHMVGDHRRELEAAARARARRPDLLRPVLEEVRALAALGRATAVVEAVDLAFALPPQPLLTPADVAREAAEELRAHGHPREAERVLDMALAWYGARPAEEETDHRPGLARTLYAAGRWDDAASLFGALSAEAPADLGHRGYLGVLAAHRGDATGAERISRSLARETWPFLPGEATLWRARIAAASGDPGEALELLRAALAQGHGHGMWLHTDPALSSLRELPGYRRLLQPRG